MTVSLTLLTTPVDRPNYQSNDVSWSPGAGFLAVGSTSSPYLWLYRRVENTLERRTVADTPPRSVTSVAWSPDGAYLAVAVSAPVGYGVYALRLYRADGLTVTLVGQYSYEYAVFRVAWSADGAHLVAINKTYDLARVYKRTGDSLELVQTLSGLDTLQDASFSPDGTYLAVAIDKTPHVSIYRRDGDVYTKLSTPAVTPGYACYALDWSYDGAYLAVATDGPGASTVCVYSHSGDAFSAVVEDHQLEAFSLGGLSWSSGAYTFAVGAMYDDYLFVLSVVDGALVAETERSFFYPGIESFLDWSPNDNYLATTQSTQGFAWYLIEGVELPESAILGALYVEDLLDALDATGQIPLAIYGAMFEVDDGASVYGTLYQRTTSAPGAYARYLCTLSDLVLPISSLSSRMAAGEQSYLSVVVPDADRYRAEILARAGGWLKVYRIAYDASGAVLSTTLIASTKQDSVRFHAGSSSGSAQLSGRAVAVTDEHLIVPIEGVLSVASHDGMLVVRATPSAVLRPGHTALVPRVDGGEDQLEIESISFGANTQGESFEIAGRMI